MALHRKLYKKYGNGVELRCDDKVIASSVYKETNFRVSNCPCCDMEVTTIGCSPETDKVQECIRGVA